jgi:integrase
MVERTASKSNEYGEGSVYQRSSDGLWVGTIEAGWTASGARRRIPVYGKTEAAVRRKLRDKKLEIERDGNTSVSQRATVKSWAEQWLPIIERNLAPSSYTATASAVNHWIVPTIGHRRFNMLTPADVRAVAQAQRTAGRSSSTQARTHSALMSLLKAAQQEGYPVPPRVLGVKAPAIAANDRTDIAVDEAVRLITTSEEKAAELAALKPGAHPTARWLVALLEGVRQAETLGLRWSAIDFDEDLIHVSWQLKPLPYRVPRDRSSGFRVPDKFEAIRLHNAYHLVRPKSDAGWRTIPLLPWVKTALQTWREVAPESPYDLVFPDAAGMPLSSKVDDARWYALQEAAEVAHPGGERPYTIHENRHTTGQLLLEAGVDPVLVVAILGHADIKTSRTYQRAKVAALRAALDQAAAPLAALGEVLGR